MVIAAEKRQAKIRRALNVRGMEKTTAVVLPLVFALALAGLAFGAPSPETKNGSPQKSDGRKSPAATVTPEGGKPATYVGDQVCKACHAQQEKDFLETMMGKVLAFHARDDRERLGCETCHGPASKHVEAGGGKGVGGLITFRKDSGESVKVENDQCLQCHEKGQQAFWRASTHAFRGVACVSCHTVMRKVSPRYQLAAAQRVNPFIVTRPETQVCLQCHPRKKMQINLPSHMPVREGLMVCTDCHNPHGGPYPKMLKDATANETCYYCHAEFRGPLLWAHPPVLQNCLNCHDPHGSINRFMLKIREPRLCQQCHIGTFHPGTPAGAGTVFVFSRSCTNCHSAIHGSNSPGGRVFTR